MASSAAFRSLVAFALEFVQRFLLGFLFVFRDADQAVDVFAFVGRLPPSKWSTLSSLKYTVTRLVVSSPLPRAR
jgi:hypothetical protein